MKYKPVDEKIFKKPSTSSVLTRMSIEPCERVLRNSIPEMFIEKGVLKIYSKFTGEHPCKATFLKSCFDIGALLYNCCIFSEHVLIRTPAEGCFWLFKATQDSWYMSL